MAYRVFISHSTRDHGLVIALANLLSKFGVEVFVAEWYLTPGEPLDKKVFQQIDRADCVVALLTRNGVRSNYVHQEIGYTIKAEKPLIPLVEKGIDPKNLAALHGREYIEYNPLEPQEALIRASTYVKSLKLRKREQEKNSTYYRGYSCLTSISFWRRKMKIKYIPSKDELLLEISPVRRKPNKKLGPFKFWWDDEGNICTFAITKYTDELREFKKNLNIVQLGGIWKGIKITDKDIRKTREALLKRLEEKW